MSLDAWSAFLIAAALVAISPGANNLLALTNGLRSGFVPAVLALAGRCAAFAVLIAAVIAGLGVVLTTSETAFRIVKWLGVAYLAYLGVRLWLDDGSSVAPRDEPAADQAASAAQLARREFLVAVTNPKAVLLFTAFLPQFVDPARPLGSQLVILGAAYGAVELVAASVWAGVGSRLKALRLSGRGRRRMSRLSGGVMLGMAAWLAAAKR
jgi:threonine/homoserine/homoserine lactone efflux protein